MKKIKLLRSVPADAKRGTAAYTEGQLATVDDATAAKLLNRSRPLAVLIPEQISVRAVEKERSSYEVAEGDSSTYGNPQSTAEAFYAKERVKLKQTEPAKHQAKPSKQ